VLSSVIVVVKTKIDTFHEISLKSVKLDSRTTCRLILTAAVPKPLVAWHVYRPASVAWTSLTWSHVPARWMRNLCQPRWTLSESLVHETSGRGSPWIGHEMRTVEPTWTTNVDGYCALICGGCAPVHSRHHESRSYSHGPATHVFISHHTASSS